MFQECLDMIEMYDAALEECIDYNSFAGPFVCDRATGEVLAAVAQAEAALAAAMAAKEESLRNLFGAEGLPGEAWEAFC